VTFPRAASFSSASPVSFSKICNSLPLFRCPLIVSSLHQTKMYKLTLVVLALFLTLFGGPVVLRAQDTDQNRPETPKPKGHPGTTSLSVPYEPITGRQRLQWFFSQSIGPPSLFVGVLSAGINTARDKPVEYGPHWEGFGDRYGMRLTGVVTGNAMNAGFGAIWGEDPRYFTAEGHSFGYRVLNVVVFTFMAKRRDGHLAPAYARYIATPGNNFLSNTWRVDSEANTSSALRRTAIGFAGRLGANAFREFWPDAKRLITHRSN
jgi:hypothetical protein